MANVSHFLLLTVSLLLNGHGEARTVYMTNYCSEDVGIYDYTGWIYGASYSYATSTSDCVVTLEADDYSDTLTVDLWSTDFCTGDALYIYDSSTQYGPLLATIRQGASIFSNTYTSTNKYITLKLTRHQCAGSYQGFSLKYTVNSPLSGGAIAAIIIGVVSLVSLAIGLVILVLVRRRRRYNNATIISAGPAPYPSVAGGQVYQATATYPAYPAGQAYPPGPGNPAPPPYQGYQTSYQGQNTNLQGSDNPNYKP